MGLGRRIRRGIRRIGREISRGVRRIGREASWDRVLIDPLERGFRGLRDVAIDPIFNPQQDFMKQQANMNKEMIAKQEADAKKAKEEAEQALKDQREGIMEGYEDTSSALGNLGVSQDQTLGGATSALGAPTKKKKKA